MSDEKQNIIKLAFVYTQNGEWYKAIEEYRKILQSEPDNAALLNSIGDAFGRKGDDQDALDSYWHARGIFMAQGNTAKVGSIEKKVAKLNADRMDAKHKALVRTLQKTSEADQMVQEGRFDEALGLYRQMIEAEPSNHSYREKLAAIFLENAQVSEAADEFRAIAQAHLEAGHVEPAKLYLAKSAEIDGDSPAQVRLECFLAESAGDTAKLGELMERLAQSEHQSGRHELALEAAKKAQAAGRGGLDMVIANSQLALKQYPEARAAFQKLHDANPSDDSLLEPLLTLDEQAKDWASAVGRVNQLLARKGDDPGLLNRAARIHLQAGKSPEAAQIYLKLAGGAFKEGKFDAVLNYFSSILAFQPDNVEILKKKAEILFKMGKRPETIAAYKELEKTLTHKKLTDEARKIAMLVNKIQSLPDHPTKGTV